MSKTDEKKPTIQVLERAFDLLEVLASFPDPVSLKLIAERSGLHPSTAHRILNDLTIGRFVDRPEAGSYRLGMRLLELGNMVKARLDVREAVMHDALLAALLEGLLGLAGCLLLWCGAFGRFSLCHISSIRSQFYLLSEVCSSTRPGAPRASATSAIWRSDC